MKKIVVIGGTGLIGKQVVEALRAQGHEAVAASRRAGIDAMTGEGLAEALRGAHAVIDAANAPTFVPEELLAFFETTTRNLLAAEREAGVKHHVVLSILGAGNATDNPYYAAKVAQEAVARAGGVPVTIVQAAQFYEFVPALAQMGTRDDGVHAPPAFIQPVDSRDVAEALARIAVGEAQGVVELAGPQLYRVDQLVREYFAATKNGQPVITDPATSYFGAPLRERDLLPSDRTRHGTRRYDDYLRALT